MSASLPGHIRREARALAACDGHEFDWWDLRPSERLRYHEEAREIADELNRVSEGERHG
jgi:hypothetical protein